MQHYSEMEERQFQIRRAGRDDLSSLLDLYRHLNPADDRTPLDRAVTILDELMSYKGSAVFVGEIDGVPVSSCTLIVVPNLTREGRSYGLIENVVTHCDFRQRGFGTLVLHAASQAAWDADCYKIMLMTGSTRRETHGFYLGAGFEQSKIGFQKRRIAARSE